MIAIKGGKVNTITNGILEEAIILVENGKIKAVGKNIDIPADAEIIDASGFWVTPGLIDAHTHISTFNEPQTMPGSYDGNEISNPITAQIRAMDALNPDDFAIPRVRKAGFTTVCTLPGSANIIGGTGIVFKLRGKTAEEMAIKGTEQMKMALGENPRRVYGLDKKMPVTRMGVAALLRETLYDAVNYSNQLELAKEDPTKAPKPDFKLAALTRVVRGEQKVRIHCHRADDIMTAMRIAEEYKLDYSIEHATEGYKIADILGAKKATCVVGPLLMDPSKQELWNVSEETAGILDKAGVKVCLTADTGSSTAWLPGNIGLLIRRGLSEEAAFRAVTINPAELLGVSDRVGSIEVGKDADLAVFDGNPFSTMTLCRMTMIDGVVYECTL